MHSCHNALYVLEQIFLPTSYFLTQKRGINPLKTFPTRGIRRTKDENRFRDVKKVQEREKRAFCPQKWKKEEMKEETMPKN